ncbi:saccharopine dehydrogenase C-terminal domain-containing protein [Anaerolineales bacterium HSG24]|nr:saccharopine dehydrogenase C-terminal domain-containing protein [Anaerolineales bacterium HSG24]
MKIIVLGTGLVGQAIVKDLAQDMTVTAVDINEQALNRLKTDLPSITTIQVDVQQAGRVAELVADFDLAICAVPGFMGFETLKQIISAGKNVVDISFFSEDPFLLDELAQEKGVTAVVDCGVAPGLCNIIAGYVDTLFDQTERYLCYVGGLPRVRQWPYEYKAVFSPIDVLEEYTRPARFVEYGQAVVRPALSDAELVDLPEVGTVEAFNTDGLRSLMTTLSAPFMKEKTLRYPGHINLMRAWRESGFFDTEPIEVEGQMVRPIALTAKLLFEQWRMQPDEEDLTVMQVIMEGQKGDKRYRYTYDLFDTYHRETQTTSMARTTGYTCTIVARQLIKGMVSQVGIVPPEHIGQTSGCFEDLLAEYAQRDIRVRETVVGL